MGNDGGSIPTRRELVKEIPRASATQVKVQNREKLDYAWSTDPLSGKILRPPIVSDCLGRLFRKDTILEYLLALSSSQSKNLQKSSKLTSDSSEIPIHDFTTGKLTPGLFESEQQFADATVKLHNRINSLRDVVEIHFTSKVNRTNSPTNLSLNSSHGSLSSNPPQSNLPYDDNDALLTYLPWVCPLSGKVLGPSVKSVYIVPCGHVISASAIKQVNADLNHEKMLKSLSTSNSSVNISNCSTQDEKLSQDNELIRQSACPVCDSTYLLRDVIPILPNDKDDLEFVAVRSQELSRLGLTHSLKKLPTTKKRKRINPSS